MFNVFYIQTIRAVDNVTQVCNGMVQWYGHVMRRDQEYVERKIMEMELPGKRGRPNIRFLDAVKKIWRKLVRGKRTLKTGCCGRTSYAVATLD